MMIEMTGDSADWGILSAFILSALLHYAIMGLLQSRLTYLYSNIN